MIVSGIKHFNEQLNSYASYLKLVYWAMEVGVSFFDLPRRSFTDATLYFKYAYRRDFFIRLSWYCDTFILLYDGSSSRSGLSLVGVDVSFNACPPFEETEQNKPAQNGRC